MNVFETCPVFENDWFLIRLVQEDDSEDLLEVYSDSQAQKFFNGDNCHGDDFHYETLERMKKAVEFWKFSYENKYFVRWAIVDKTAGIGGKTVGTIELFHRDSKDFFNDCGLLRLDLSSVYEKEECITQILNLLISDSYDLFYCKKIATKNFAESDERKKSLEMLGFTATDEKLIGNDGEEYSSYFYRNAL